MPRVRIELLADQMVRTYDEAWGRLTGLTEPEYFWEPVPDCWTVYQSPDGGRWTYNYELPAPEPHPFTTIAWRIVHLALCKVMYHEYAFGPGELDWMTIETPPTMNAALKLLSDGQAQIFDDLLGLPDDRELDVDRLTNWGEMMPTWRIFWILIHHDAHHGGEIGTLRDLYLHSRRGALLS